MVVANTDYRRMMSSVEIPSGTPLRAAARSRACAGRKNRFAFEVNGTRGSLAFDLERLNELQVNLVRSAPGARTQGFRTVLTAPHHPPYDRFIPAPGHGLGFNELKIIECRQLIGRMRGEATVAIDFEEGAMIERTVDAMARSFREGRWVDVG